MKPSKRRSKLMFRVVKGALAPADNYTAERLRARGYHLNDIVLVEITKPRNPGFHRLVHRIGLLCASNIDAFTGMTAHAVLKRLQWEANIGCEELGVMMPGIGYALMRIPLSLSYEMMDDGEFHEIARGFCRHIAENYWKTMTEEAISEMAESFVEE